MNKPSRFPVLHPLHALSQTIIIREYWICSNRWGLFWRRMIPKALKEIAPQTLMALLLEIPVDNIIYRIAWCPKVLIHLWLLIDNLHLCKTYPSWIKKTKTKLNSNRSNLHAFLLKMLCLRRPPWSTLSQNNNIPIIFIAWGKDIWDRIRTTQLKMDETSPWNINKKRWNSTMRNSWTIVKWSI